MICADCSHFIPNPSTPLQGLGLCGLMQAWLAKLAQAGQRMKPKDYDANLRKLGGKLCWPFVERQCQRFSPVLSR